MRIMVITLLAVLSFLWLAGACDAQTLPKAEDLIERYVQGTGGKDAYAKLKNRVSRGTVELAGLNRKGTLSIYQAAPNLFLEEMVLEDLGKFRQGSNGQVAWQFLSDGVHLLNGKDKAIFLLTCYFNTDLNWRQIFSKVECISEEKMGDKSAYKVACTLLDGSVLYKYYDKATSLALKAEMRRDTLVTTTLVSDYRKVDGILLPHRIVDQLGSTQTIMVLTTIEHNVSLPANKFDLPAAGKKTREIQ